MLLLLRVLPLVRADVRGVLLRGLLRELLLRVLLLRVLLLEVLPLRELLLRELLLRELLLRGLLLRELLLRELRRELLLRVLLMRELLLRALLLQELLLQELLLRALLGGEGEDRGAFAARHARLLERPRRRHRRRLTAVTRVLQERRACGQTHDGLAVDRDLIFRELLRARLETDALMERVETERESHFFVP